MINIPPIKLVMTGGWCRGHCFAHINFMFKRKQAFRLHELSCLAEKNVQAAARHYSLCSYNSLVRPAQQAYASPYSACKYKRSIDVEQVSSRLPQELHTNWQVISRWGDLIPVKIVNHKIQQTSKAPGMCFTRVIKQPWGLWVYPSPDGETNRSHY